MARSPGCPPAESLAAFMDAGPSWRKRRALVAHLDGCSRCRTVLAYAGQFEASLTPEPAVAGDSSGWRLRVPPRFALAAGITCALLVGLLATPSFGPPIASWFTGGPNVGVLTTEAVVSPLFLEKSDSSYSDHRWSGQTNSFSFGAGPTPSQTAFRIGVQLVDFRVGLEEGRLEDASGALENLRSLSRSLGGGELLSNRWSSMGEALSEDVAKERFVEELALLDAELSAALDPVALDLGRWTEAGRLAAARHHTRYFADPYFRAVLAELSERGLSQPVEQALDAIRTNTSPTSTEIDVAELEKGFRQLILLH